MVSAASPVTVLAAEAAGVLGTLVGEAAPEPARAAPVDALKAGALEDWAGSAAEPMVKLCAVPAAPPPWGLRPSSRTTPETVAVPATIARRIPTDSFVSLGSFLRT